MPFAPPHILVGEAPETSSPLEYDRTTRGRVYTLAAFANTDSPSYRNPFYCVLEGNRYLFVSFFEAQVRNHRHVEIVEAAENTIRAHATASCELSALAGSVNNFLVQARESLFCALFLAWFDLSTNSLRYCNAGQYPLLVRGRDEVICLDEGGAPPGEIVSEPYFEEAMAIKMGDVLVVYNDALASDFSPDRLIEIVREYPCDDAYRLRDRIATEWASAADVMHPPGDAASLIIKRADGADVPHSLPRVCTAAQPLYRAVQAYTGGVRRRSYWALDIGVPLPQ